MGNLNKKESVNVKKTQMIENIISDIVSYTPDNIRKKFNLVNINDKKYKREIFIQPKDRAKYSSTELNKQCYFRDIHKEIIKESLVEYFNDVDFVTNGHNEIVHMANFITEFWSHAAHNYNTYLSIYPIAYDEKKFIATANEKEAFDYTLQKIIGSVDFTGDKLREFTNMSYVVMRIDNMRNVKKDTMYKFYDEVIRNVIKARGIIEDHVDSIYSVLHPNNDTTTDINTVEGTN